MGKIIIKFCRKSYSNDQDIRNLFAYIAGKGKNSEKETAVTGSKGLSRDCYKAAEQVIAAQRLLKKNTGQSMLLQSRLYIRAKLKARKKPTRPSTRQM